MTYGNDDNARHLDCDDGFMNISKLIKLHTLNIKIIQLHIINANCTSVRLFKKEIKRNKGLIHATTWPNLGKC